MNSAQSLSKFVFTYIHADIYDQAVDSCLLLIVLLVTMNSHYVRHDCDHSHDIGS